MSTELHPNRLSIRFCLETNLDRSFRTINLDPRSFASESYLGRVSGLEMAIASHTFAMALNWPYEDAGHHDQVDIVTTWYRGTYWGEQQQSAGLRQCALLLGSTHVGAHLSRGEYFMLMLIRSIYQQGRSKAT
jgi:hypothetical protein